MVGSSPEFAPPTQPAGDTEQKPEQKPEPAPTNPVLRAGHRVYFGTVVPRLGALLSDADAYRYLPESVAYLPGTDRLLGLVRDAGFGAVTRTPLSRGIALLISATRQVGTP